MVDAPAAGCQPISPADAAGMTGSPDRGSFDPETDTGRWPPRGWLRLVLGKALRRDSGDHDLTCRIRRRDGVWDRDGLAEAPTFNGETHRFTVRREADGLAWRLTGTIRPDPWVVVGGPLAVTVDLEEAAAGIHRGRYHGVCAGREVTGEVTVAFDADRPVARGRARRPLRILTAADGRLWDHRQAGWRAGDEPEVPEDLPVFEAVHFGVEADSGRECAPGLRAAIAAAAAAGGGVVRLPAGTLDYRIDGWQPPIVIDRPRIIIRGAGSGTDGTLIVNHRYADHAANPAQPWKAGQWPMFRFDGRGPAGLAGQMGTDAPARATVADPVVAAEIHAATRGSPILELAPGHRVRAGRDYLLVHLEAAGLPLITALIGDACTPAAHYREVGAQQVRQLVTVARVAGDQAVLDAPVHWTRRDAWQARLLEVDLLAEVGLCHLRLRGRWDGHFTHHWNPEHDNGWDQVGGTWCRDAFIHDTVHENCTTAVGLANCRHTTISRVRVTGNPGHNGICLGGASTACLLRACDIGRQMHAINISGTPCGTVIHDCRIDEPGGLDLHGSTGLDTLVDGLTGGVLVGGGSREHVPPRHGPHLVMWNWAQGHYHPYRAWKKVRRLASWHDTPGFVAIGVHTMDGHPLVYEGPDGESDADRCDDRAWVESLGQPVMPASLYRWQRDRAPAGVSSAP
jgi:hypothetical protein